MNNTTYRIANINQLLADSKLPQLPIFVGEYRREGMKSYFEAGYTLFEKRLTEFHDLKRPLTAEEEKELNFMLSALISAKNILEERE